MATNAGKLVWIDTTVADPSPLRDFYAAVMNWGVRELDCGGHVDYSMLAADGVDTAGVCHRLGGNASLPAGWIPYFAVADLAASVAEIVARGGAIVGDPKAAPVFFRDPSGAAAALVQAEDAA